MMWLAKLSNDLKKKVQDKEPNHWEIHIITRELNNWCEI